MSALPEWSSQTHIIGEMEAKISSQAIRGGFEEARNPKVCAFFSSLLEAPMFYRMLRKRP